MCWCSYLRFLHVCRVDQETVDSLPSFQHHQLAKKINTQFALFYLSFFQHHQLTKLREAINEKYGEDLQDYHQVGIVIAGMIEVFDKDKCGDNRKIKEINKTDNQLIFQLHSWSVQNYGQFWQELTNQAISIIIVFIITKLQLYIHMKKV